MWAVTSPGSSSSHDILFSVHIFFGQANLLTQRHTHTHKKKLNIDENSDCVSGGGSVSSDIVRSSWSICSVAFPNTSCEPVQSKFRTEQ